jgi:hypothetical protein
MYLWDSLGLLKLKIKVSKEIERICLNAGTLLK